jgi:O-antigen/teichoic acid export membrane protein
MFPPDPTTLKQRVLSAGGWNIAGYGLGQAIRLGSNLIMTRLLVPEMFGVMAIATMVTVVLSLLSDIGLRQNIVQSRRGDDPAFLDTAWVVQIVRGGLLWLIAILLSLALYLANNGGLLPAKSVYASPVLPFVVAVTSLSAIISGFQSTKWATAYRRFDQKRITQIELIAQVIAIPVMIIAGTASRSIWALVAGGLVASVTTMVLSHTWISGHPNRFRCEKDALREMIHFGRWIFVSSAVGIFAANGDRLLLGGVVDAHALGLYVIATLMVGAIAGGVSRFFSMVVLPALSEIARNDPSRLREIYYRLRTTDNRSALRSAVLRGGRHAASTCAFALRGSLRGRKPGVPRCWDTALRSHYQHCKLRIALLVGSSPVLPRGHARCDMGRRAPFSNDFTVRLLL